MSEKVFVVAATDSVAHVKNELVRRKVSVLPVMSGDKLVGTITERDLSSALYHTRDPIDEIEASQVMRKTPPMVDPSDSPEQVARVMSKAKVGSVTVFDKENKEVMGIITKTDIAKHFVRNCAGEATVAQLMSRDVKTIGRHHTIFRAAREMEDNGIGRLVVKDGKVVGIVSSRDLALMTYGLTPSRVVLSNEKTRGHRVDMKPVVVEDVMRTDVYTIPSKSDAVSAAKLMLEKKVGSLVVMDNNELKGILTKSDFVHYLAKKA